MQQQSLSFRPDAGWSQPLPAELDGPQTLVLAFAGPGVAKDGTPQQAALRELAAAFPRSVFAGCSSAGEILGERVRDDSISVVVARFEHTPLARAVTPLEGPEDSLQAGQRLAQQLPHEGLKSVLVLSDGLHVNGSPLVEGLRQALPAGVVVTGGLAGDGERFGQTWVLDGFVPRRQHVIAIGLYGDRVRVGHGCDGGWDDFGPERRITRAEGNVLYELDGKPALDLYKTYLGDRAAGLPGTALLFPLAVRREGGGAPLVRTILAIDEDKRSMTFAGDIPQGGIARLMRSTTERLIDSAGRAAANAFSTAGDQGDVLAITVSCVGRRLVLGERTEEEVEAVLDRAPRRCGHVGFYSYGEISPLVAGAVSELHNQTMTVTVLAEA